MQVDRKVLEEALEALEPMQNDRDDTAIQRAITALRAALSQPEPLGPGESWEYDDGLTMNRRVYHHGKLRAVIPIEIIQDTPQMRPFRVAHSFGNREHRPTDRQENV
jgi:hypothetical protein